VVVVAAVLATKALEMVNQHPEARKLALDRRDKTVKTNLLTVVVVAAAVAMGATAALLIQVT
jgi:hypothetical protein